jgi:hypothetical protein
LANFQFDKTGTHLIKCATGYEPWSQSYYQTTKQYRVSFDRARLLSGLIENKASRKTMKQ